VPAPQAGHERFGVGFGLGPHGAGFTAKGLHFFCLLIGVHSVSPRIWIVSF
jgi:hypothetical protein